MNGVLSNMQVDGGGDGALQQQHTALCIHLLFPCSPETIALACLHYTQVGAARMVPLAAGEATL